MQQIHQIKMHNPSYQYIRETIIFLCQKVKIPSQIPAWPQYICWCAVGDHISHCVQLAQFSDTDIGTLCSLCRGRRITNQYATYVWADRVMARSSIIYQCCLWVGLSMPHVRNVNAYFALLSFCGACLYCIASKEIKRPFKKIFSFFKLLCVMAKL